MKNLLLLLLLFSVFFMALPSCKAQMTVPLSGYNTMDDTFLHSDVDYVKDLDGILDKFIGTWKGSNADYQYEYRVSKTTISVDNDNYLLDVLVIKYIVKDSAGTEILNTLNLSNDHNYVIEGLYFYDDGTGSYKLYYSGEYANCGQAGTMFIYVSDTNPNKMRTALDVERNLFIDPNECPNGRVDQIMPTDIIVLTKQ